VPNRKPAVKPLKRSPYGTSALELPLAMFALLIIFVFPMINYGTIFLRFALLESMAREGAHAAATAHSFSTGSAGRPSSLEATPATVGSYASRFTGIDIVSTKVSIISISRQTGAVAITTQKLATPANTANYLYFTECAVTADLHPLVEYALPPLSNVPGLRPWRTTVAIKQVAENPQGLNE
jgi:hypothetical protein